MSEKKIPVYAYGGLFYSVFHSPDDGGYYAEIYEREGVELFQTKEIRSSEELAGADAIIWIENNGASNE